MPGTGARPAPQLTCDLQGCIAADCARAPAAAAAGVATPRRQRLAARCKHIVRDLENPQRQRSRTLTRNCNSGGTEATMDLVWWRATNLPPHMPAACSSYWSTRIMTRFHPEIALLGVRLTCVQLGTGHHNSDTNSRLEEVTAYADCAPCRTGWRV